MALDLPTPVPAADVDAWSDDVDVVVVGYGIAGACAALEAARAGASVILLERAAEHGQRGRRQQRLQHAERPGRGGNYQALDLVFTHGAVDPLGDGLEEVALVLLVPVGLVDPRT